MFGLMRLVENIYTDLKQKAITNILHMTISFE